MTKAEYAYVQMKARLLSTYEICNEFRHIVTNEKFVTPPQTLVESIYNRLHDTISSLDNLQSLLETKYYLSSIYRQFVKQNGDKRLQNLISSMTKARAELLAYHRSLKHTKQKTKLKSPLDCRELGRILNDIAGDCFNVWNIFVSIKTGRDNEIINI